MMGHVLEVDSDGGAFHVHDLLRPDARVFASYTAVWSIFCIFGLVICVVNVTLLLTVLTVILELCVDNLIEIH